MKGVPPGEAALVLRPSSPQPVVEIGRILSYHLELHPTDAISHARYSGGVLLCGVAPEVADSIAARLAEQGVQSVRILAETLRQLPRRVRTRSLEFTAEGMVARSPGGAERLIAREDIRAIHLYALRSGPDSASPDRADPKLSKLRSLPGIRTLASRPRPLKPREEEELRHGRWFQLQHFEVGEELEMSQRAMTLREALVEPDGGSQVVLHFTIFTPDKPIYLQQGDIDYAPLGNEMMRHSLDNFLLLLERIRDLAPDAWLMEQVSGFLEKLDPSECLYFKPEEVQNFQRWMQLWISMSEKEEK